MRRMLLVLGLLCLGPAVPAAASQWSIGTNFGISFLDPSGKDVNQTYLAWPAAVGGLQPGLRVGYQLDNPRHELFADTGFLWVDRDNSSSKDFELSGNYQFNVSPDAKTNVFFTGGVGLAYNGVDLGPLSAGGTSVTLGGGIGARWKIAAGHGSVRTEFRLDKVTQAKDGNIIVRDDGVVPAIKIGFDLWL